MRWNPEEVTGEKESLLSQSANALGIAYREMATVGHDASIFARAGIPSAMVLIRNQHGSHNAQEAMEMVDFKLGSQVLTFSLYQMSGL